MYIKYILFVNELFEGNILNKPEFKAKWFQVFLSNTNNSI